MRRVSFLCVVALLMCVSNVYAQNEFHFNGTLSVNWSDSGNWKDGLKPIGEQTVVFLHSSVCVDENVIVDDLLYADTSVVVTVASNCRLAVKGAFEPLSASHLIVEDGAQLVCVDHQVQATVRKVISPVSTAKEMAAWHLVASPLVGELSPTDLDSLVYENANYELMRFNQSNSGNEWEMYKDEAYQASFALDNGHGYLYANGSEVTVSFIGLVEACNHPLSFPLDYDDGAISLAKGFNLMGNPFTCSAYIDRSFYRMNVDGTDFQLVRASSNSPIASCEGVMVQASEVGQSVTFGFDSISVEDRGCLHFTLSQNNNVVNEFILSFNESDALGVFNFTEHKASLYIPQNGVNCAIAVAETTCQTPLHFKTSNDGDFVLNVTSDNVEINSLWLLDNKTGSEVNLLTTPNYTFSASSDDYASRFKLFVNTDYGFDETAENEPFAYLNNGRIVITDLEGLGNLKVVDLLGRVVLETTVDGPSELSFDLTPGVYVLRLATANAVMTQKVAL